MILSEFRVSQQDSPHQRVIKEVFQRRKHKKVKVDKEEVTALSEPTLNKATSYLSYQSSMPEAKEDKVLNSQETTVTEPIKHKLIAKSKRQYPVQRQHKSLNRLYNRYLLNFMHKSNLMMIEQGRPPTMSALDSVDDGDYIEDESGNEYDRKDYPHYSNVIRPQEIQAQKPTVRVEKTVFRMNPVEALFHEEDNCVFKIKHVFSMVGALFKRSIHFQRKKRLQRRDNVESENYEFEAIAEQLGLRFSTVKLLFDMLDMFFDLDGELQRNEESKIKASNEIKKSLLETLKSYRVEETVFVPQEELFVSLGQLRRLLHAEQERLQRQQREAQEHEDEQ